MAEAKDITISIKVWFDREVDTILEVLDAAEMSGKIDFPFDVRVVKVPVKQSKRK